MTDATTARARNFRLGTAALQAARNERLNRYDQLVDVMSRTEAAAALGITLRTTEEYEAALPARPHAQPPAGRRDDAFMLRGACRTADPDLFDTSQSTNGQPTAEAKRVCGGCEVEARCLEWATRTFQVGVWGGKTDAERDELREQERRDQGEP